MKIVIDARMINASGIGRYLRNLLEELQKLDKDNEYYILHLKSDYDTLVYHSENFRKVLADFRWYTTAEQLRLPGILRKINPDLVHLPHFNVPILYKGKYVVTIHDLIHQHHDSQKATTKDPVIFKIKKIAYNSVFRKAVNGSEKILTPSEFAKEQLIEEWQVDVNKIVVTPEGVDTKILTIVTKMSTSREKEILEKFGIKQPYIFYVGNAHPHKNVEGLVIAFQMIVSRRANVNHIGSGLASNLGNLQLVLVGQDSVFWQRIKQSIISLKEEIQDNIIFAGEVTDEELVVLYKNANAFVMPSFEEGFGIPILEAMALGCPVVSSNAGSLKEVGGEAALYFDPRDLGDMGDKIEKLLTSEKLRKELIEKGKQRVKLFSWKKMAQQTLGVYNTV